jgi:hypothetical protein
MRTAMTCPRSNSLKRLSSNDDVLNQGSMHSAQSKQTTGTAGETSTETSNTSNCCRISQVDNASWSMNSLVPVNDESNHTHAKFMDSFVVCSDDGVTDPWWESLETPLKTPKESTRNTTRNTIRPSAVVKTPSDTVKSSSKSTSKNSRFVLSKPSRRNSSSRLRDVTPRSPTRQSSGRGDDDKDRSKKSPRRDEKESKSRRTSSKSPTKSHQEKPEYRRSLSESSIMDIPSIDLTSPQKSTLTLEPKTVSVPRTKSHRGRTQSSVSPTRRVAKNPDEADPVSTAVKAPATKRTERSSSRAAASCTERKESLTKRPSSPPRARNDNSRPSRHASTSPPRNDNSRPSRHASTSPPRTPRVKSPTRVRVESPVRTRSDNPAVESTLEESRSSPKKTKSAPVQDSSRRSKGSSRRIKSATTTATAGPNNEKTEEDVLDFIAARIRHLEQTTDMTIEYTVRRREGHRRTSLDAISVTKNRSDVECGTGNPAAGHAAAPHNNGRRRSSVGHFQ